MALNVSVAG